MDDEPRRREIAKALENWVLTAFVAGAMIYGVLIRIRHMIAGTD